MPDIAMQNLLTVVDIESEVTRLFFDQNNYRHIVELPEKNLLEFFNYLIPDWKLRGNTGRKSISFCDCIKKREAILKETRLELMQELIDLLKNQEKSLFHFYAYHALHQLIHEISNDDKKVEFIDELIQPRRAIEFDQYLEGINEEFKKCLKLTFVGSLYLFIPDYNFEEDVTEEKFELLKYLFTCQLSRFELKFREYVETEKRRLGSYHQISLKPVIRFYYNLAKNAVENTTVPIRKQHQFINFQELIAHSFPGVEKNSFLVTKFYEQRHVRIFDDSKKDDENIKKVLWPVARCRVATRLKVLGFPTGVTENDMNKVN